MSVLKANPGTPTNLLKRLFINGKPHPGDSASFIVTNLNSKVKYMETSAKVTFVMNYMHVYDIVYDSTTVIHIVF